MVQVKYIQYLYLVLCLKIGSEEELSSLKDAYVVCKGDITKIIDSVMCATIEDEQRFRDLLQPLIDSKELPTYKKFSSESAASKKKRQSKVNIFLRSQFVRSFYCSIEHMLFHVFSMLLFS